MNINGFIGEEGLIVQYEDIISMTGFNIARHIHNEAINDKLNKMSVQDILLNYINRDHESPVDWLKNEFNINFNKIYDSQIALQPNLLYTYKVFNNAHKEGIKNLYVYSNTYSSIIENVVKSYDIPSLEYVYGDFNNLIKTHPNCTFLTSSVKNIKKCIDINIPLALTICDDYLHISNIFSSNVNDVLTSKPNIVLRFTGVISAGIF